MINIDKLKRKNKLMKIEHYFATPFLHKEIGSHEFCNKLQNFILDSMTNDNKNKNAPQSSHPDLFESNFNFLNWNTPLTNELKNIMLKHLLEFIQRTNNLTIEQIKNLRFNHESWYHVARRGGYFQAHTHPNHSWSMVFCVNPGDKTGNDFESGKLLFIDPRFNASMYLDPANNQMKRDYSFNGMKLTPKKGSLIIFPSYLQHSVEPYIGKEYRITVAANFRFHYNG